MSAASSVDPRTCIKKGVFEPVRGGVALECSAAYQVHYVQVGGQKTPVPITAGSALKTSLESTMDYDEACRQRCRKDDDCLFYAAAAMSSAVGFCKTYAKCGTPTAFTGSPTGVQLWARQNHKPSWVTRGEIVELGFAHWQKPYSQCASASNDLQATLDSTVTGGAVAFFLDRRWCPSEKTTNYGLDYKTEWNKKMTADAASAAADNSLTACLERVGMYIKKIGKACGKISKFLKQVSKVSIGFMKTILKIGSRLLKVIQKGLKKASRKFNRVVDKLKPRFRKVCRAANKVRPVLYTILSE